MVLGPWVSLCLLERGVVCQPASQAWNVLKLTPPLTIDDAATARAIDAVVEVRFARRLPSIIIAPRPPHELMRAYVAHPGGDQAWLRLYDGMYSSSLIAL